MIYSRTCTHHVTMSCTDLKLAHTKALAPNQLISERDYVPIPVTIYESVRNSLLVLLIMTLYDDQSTSDHA